MSTAAKKTNTHADTKASKTKPIDDIDHDMPELEPVAETETKNPQQMAEEQEKKKMDRLAMQYLFGSISHVPTLYVDYRQTLVFGKVLEIIDVDQYKFLFYNKDAFVSYVQSLSRVNGIASLRPNVPVADAMHALRWLKLYVDDAKKNEKSLCFPADSDASSSSTQDSIREQCNEIAFTVLSELDFPVKDVYTGERLKAILEGNESNTAAPAAESS